MKKLIMLIIPLFCLISSKAIHPVENKNTVPFSRAREIILSQNPGLKSLHTENEAARAGVAQAGVRPNPSVSITLDKFGSNEIETSVEQTIELGPKRQLRTEAAQKELHAAENNQKIFELELEAEIVRRFIPIAIVSKKSELLDSVIRIAQETRNQIKIRVENGAAKKTDLIRTEIDIEKLELERSELLRQKEQSRKKFAALGGEQYEELLNVSGSILDGEEIPSLEDLRQAITLSPQVTTINIEREKLLTQQKQLKAEATPDLNLSAGYLRNNSDNSSSPLIGLSITLPLFNRNTAAQNQSLHQRQALEERRKNTLKLLDAEVEDLHSRLLEIDKKIILLKTSTIPKAEQVYKMIQEYYTAGSAGFLDLMEAQSGMLRLRMELLDTETERAETLADLMQKTYLPIPIVK